MNLSLLYRGPLASCNYGCEYCPFAKRQEAGAEHTADAQALERFLLRVEELTRHRFSILFTPWGEALIHPRYQQALARLTRLPNVAKAAIQTNLACRLEWVEQCDKRKLALWTTYHPGEVALPRFAAKCHELQTRGVPFSAGIVGLKEHFAAARQLRDALPPDAYVWVNAYKRVPTYYSDSDRQFLESIDPLFGFNAAAHPSLGKPCRAGHTAIAIDGDGVMRRCHFIREPIGNFYAPDFELSLQPRLCTNETCGCHIGYVHLQELGLDAVFGDGLLERIPLAHRRA